MKIGRNSQSSATAARYQPQSKQSRASTATGAPFARLLLSSASCAALFVATSAFAQSTDCSRPSSSHDSCTISAGNYSSSDLYIGEGDNGDDNHNGEDGPDYTFTNYGTLVSGSAQYWGLVIGSEGGNGSDDGRTDGGDGGRLTFYNYGDVTVNGTGIDTVYGLYASSAGGEGGGDSDDTGVGGGDGGRGGDGGYIDLYNYGTVAITRPLTDGGIGIFAESRAGEGGDQDSTVGDQRGGNSGDAKDLTIHNSGIVQLGTSSSYLSGRGFAWGIGVQSRGNEGGKDNGAGGTGGNVSITNEGAIGVYWSGEDGTSGGVRGIYGLSQGGDGRRSADNSNAGGDGQAGYQVQVSSSGTITVNSLSEVQGSSGGIVAISRGGDGGGAPGRNKGGDGANAGDTDGSKPGVTRVDLYGRGHIDTQGANIVGIIARSKGGDGGDGEDGSHDSSGGDGGKGGAVAVTVADQFAITTGGAAGYSVLAQSIGGAGGDGGDDKALVGTTGGGGYGGHGGSVTFNASDGAQIITRGNTSAAIVVQSIGGGGGNGGDFIAILGGEAGKGGRGGNGGDVFATNSGLLATYGDGSHGIVAQSIAGGGGTGDVPTGVVLELGGDGGNGGNAGRTDVRNSGTVLTWGEASKGIIAQSISGGGGAAGTIGGGKITIGGSGGGAGMAGAVTVGSSGIIQTDGAAATGILAQSIGGGGGTAANARGIWSVGGTGGDGGDANTVAVGAAGSIATSGTWANGITAQSIGGGGGDGGFALDFSVVIPNVGIGGAGGVGGESRDVEVGNIDPATGARLGALSIDTWGEHSYGILAQSIGGGGGSGGNAVGAGVLEFVSLQIGGNSGNGSTGDDVRVRFDGLSLTTHAADSIGIAAQSIGGGGGVGGSAYGADANLFFTYGASIGGLGGKGGDADTVTIGLTDSVIATGQASDPSTVSDAVGILAQSVGGGGGIGGRAMQAAVAQVVPVYLPVAVSGAVAIGGSGGDGGDGDNVTVDLRGLTSVATAGTGSFGILAQSIGGGGGYAKNAWTYAMTSGLGAGVFAADISVAQGGFGGGGGNGAEANVNLRDNAQIVTGGGDAHAVMAQSVGGGGGAAGVAQAKASNLFGFSSITGKVGIGGFGGDGGKGGDVSVAADSGTLISTSGQHSFGIIAQSIGGGGGTSTGLTVGVTESVSPAPPFTISASETAAIGLTGGGGGDGGRTTVTTAGTINTSGAGSVGVVAQSVGGGGGIGGSVAGNAMAGSMPLDIIKQNYNLTLSLGGTGGQGGSGDEVTIIHSGWITTTGHRAIGMLGQSIGGGGGLGGTSTITDARTTGELNMVVGGGGGLGGAGGSVSANFDGSNADFVDTGGRQAHGVVLQSIGGGGGVGGDGSSSASGRIVIGAYAGGNSGGGNRGGPVSTEGWLKVTTRGTDAIGLLAQSVGGGGGLAGHGSSSDVQNQFGVSLALAVGGSGGSGGDGGDVSVRSGVEAATYDSRAHGVVVQSIGGGGGVGIVGERGNILSLSLGGSGGVSGNGGNVMVEPTAGSIITTGGAGAYGLLAQSVGGGGGLAGDVSGGPLTFGADLGGASSGNGGTVAVTFSGALQTTGQYAHGILAQSVGGGGGLGGDNAGSYAGSTGMGSSGAGGDVTVTQGGMLVAAGEGSHGIFAQSQGPDGNGTVQVNVQGTIIGGQSSGAGVTVAGGRNNSLTIAAGAEVATNGDVAIRYLGDRSPDYGSVLEIYNFGTITGDVVLDNADHGYAGTVRNGSYNTLRSNYIQADVINSGRVVVGRDGIGKTRITGDFVQTEAGILQLAADFAAGKVSQLKIDGDATLGGHVAVSPVTLLPRTLRFLEVGGSMNGTLQGSRLNMFDFIVSRADDNGYKLSAEADFTRADLGLDAQQSRTAGHLQSIWDVGAVPFGTLFAALANGDLASYRQGLSGLQADVANAPAAESIALTQQRLDRAMACPVFDRHSLSAQSDGCFWVQAGGQYFDQDATGGSDGYSDSVYTYALGGQKQIAPDWFLGFAASYDDSDISSATQGLEIDGQIFSATLSLRHDIGNWQLGAAAAGSIGSFDINRATSFGTLSGVAGGDQNVYGLAGRLRAAYVQSFDAFYLKPYLDLDIIYTDAGGHTESGAGLLDRQVHGSSEWAVLASPMLELGTQLSGGDDYALLGYARVGLTVSSLDEWSSGARLAAAPASVASFSSALPIDDLYGRVAAGLDLTSQTSPVSLRAEYEGSFSSNATRQTGSLRLSFGF
jgi:hypothetical protein